MKEKDVSSTGLRISRPAHDGTAEDAAGGGVADFRRGELRSGGGRYNDNKYHFLFTVLPRRSSPWSREVRGDHLF